MFFNTTDSNEIGNSNNAQASEQPKKTTVSEETTTKSLLVTTSELNRAKEFAGYAEDLRALNSKNENLTIKRIVDFHIDEAEKEHSDEQTKHHLMHASSLLDSINTLNK